MENKLHGELVTPLAEMEKHTALQGSCTKRATVSSTSPRRGSSADFSQMVAAALEALNARAGLNPVCAVCVVTLGPPHRTRRQQGGLRWWGSEPGEVISIYALGQQASPVV